MLSSAYCPLQRKPSSRVAIDIGKHRTLRVDSLGAGASKVNGKTDDEADDKENEEGAEGSFYDAVSQ